jgi:hypothetical protein
MILIVRPVAMMSRIRTQEVGYALSVTQGILYRVRLASLILQLVGMEKKMGLKPVM